MKKAIGYIRISDKDQSNFSISGQQEYIERYCSQSDITLLTSFTDNGESAKNFDRADWKLLHNFIKSNYAGIDFLIVAKFDRFSRNTAEALQMIEQLETRYKIRVISVMEPIQLHPDSPYYHHFRAQIIQNAELELRIIRDRTKFGRNQAAKAGRYSNAAPYGYMNTRDAMNKPIIVPAPVRSEQVQEIFSRFLEGQPIAAIRKAMKEKGCTLQGNSSYQHLLQNPVYMGYIKKPSYYDEPESLVKGIHTPLVPETDWYQVQAIFQGKKPLQRSVQNADVPLKGVLKCFCSRLLTAGNSRGRKKYYWYYKCNTHTEINLPANQLHRQFDEMLKTLSFPPFQIKYMQQQAVKGIQQRLKERANQLQTLQSDLQAIIFKLDSLEEKYITNGIEQEVYRKWKSRYITDVSMLQQQITALRQPIEKVWQDHRANLERLADIHFLYYKSSLEGQQSFTRLVFNNQLYYQGGVYRTTFLLPPFLPKALELKEKRLLEYQQPLPELTGIVESAPHRNIIEPLERLLVWAGSVKIA